MRFGGQQEGIERTIITATNIPEITYENIVRETPQEYRSATSSGRVYESCIGSGCSRSPSPLRRDFWESNRSFPDVVLQRKAIALQGRTGEDKQQQNQRTTERGGGSRLTVRQGRSLTRNHQSREPLFVYNNDASECSDFTHCDSGNRFQADERLRYHHTPSPRARRSQDNDHFADNCNLTVEVDVADDEREETCRIVTSNNSCTSSPRGSLKVSVSNSPRADDADADADDNGCGALSCFPSARSRSRSCSPRARSSSPCQFMDRGCSPLVIRSRSRSPSPGAREGGSGGLGQGTIEVHTPERSVTIDDDDEGNLRVEISTSGENTPTAGAPIYAPCPAACCRKSPKSRPVTPPAARVQSNIEISSDDGDMHIDLEDWEGNDLRLQVDLENSDGCSTPRRVNVRCSRSPPPKSRSRSRSPSRSPSSRSPKSRSVWNTSTRSSQPPLEIVYKSHPPSRIPTPKSRTPKSRTPSPETRTPRTIEIHHESSLPSVEVDYEYTPGSVDSHSTCGRTPPRRSGSAGCRSRCSTPGRSRCSTPCRKFSPASGDIVIRSEKRKPCPCSGKDDGQVEFLCHRSARGLREGDSVVRLGKFDSAGKWCASDVVGMYMLGSQGLWMFLGEEEGHECLRPMQADQHQSVRTINKWFRPRLGDLIIHTVPGPHSFYFWNPRKRAECSDTRLLLRAYIGIPQVEDEQHNLSCCTESHLPVGYAELYVSVRNRWFFLGRDDHMFSECEITGSST
ncbi:hypothetical protein R1sor_022279 [Riccia sorocarpa]|uniref:Uncharacterized protein n=1 Tax=Riccia sorocarpa TaxID=122646 RepID=A0ABD3GJF4_9MARC